MFVLQSSCCSLWLWPVGVTVVCLCLIVPVLFLQKLVAQMKQDPQVISIKCKILQRDPALKLLHEFDFLPTDLFSECRSEEAAPWTSSKDHSAQREAGMLSHQHTHAHTLSLSDICGVKVPVYLLMRSSADTGCVCRGERDPEVKQGDIWFKRHWAYHLTRVCVCSYITRKHTSILYFSSKEPFDFCTLFKSFVVHQVVFWTLYFYHFSYFYPLSAHVTFFLI